jgi:diguanylate cyclase (GGDEF)-like protein
MAETTGREGPKRLRARADVNVVDRRESLLATESQMRLARWIAIVFVVVQFLLYRPPVGTTVPFPQLTVGLVIAILVLGVNLVSLAARGVEDNTRLARIGDVELFADTLLAMGVVWLFSFDPTSSLWALLMIPALEGAMRRQRRGALAVWAICAVFYGLRDFWASRTYPVVQFQIPSITYRMGMILIVAAAIGTVARNLHRRVSEELVARRESEHRARLLRIVAGASRTMTTPDVERVLATVVESTLEVGFEAGAIALFDETGETYEYTERRGITEPVSFGVMRSNEGIVGLARRRREMVVINEYSQWPGSLAEIRPLGLRAVGAAPIWCGGELEAMLVVGTRERNTILRAEMECLELLALQAGAALTNARRYIERSEFQRQLHHETLHDSLTGLPNRSLFLDRLAHCMERKEGAPSPTAVLFFDIDDFKRINDSLGHAAGDALLRAFAARLDATRDPGDTVARYGGDEFILLIEEAESRQGALETANRLLSHLQAPFMVNDREVFVTVSVGVSYGSSTLGSSRDFVREADLAMERAKEHGGGRCEAYRPEMIAKAEQRLALEFELRRGFEEGSFVVYYQPVVHIPDRRIVALEALVRWQHPERGLLLPMEFIPFAEESELIVPLGHWILNDVCRQLNVWRASHPNWPRLPVGINLSAKEFRQDNFVDLVVGAFEAHKIHPSDVVFEITESVLMRDNAATLTQMKRLGRLGVRMAIDDFGLGYSSLSYLKRFPFSVLKIDRSFVDGIAATATDQAIVRSVLGLASDLGIAVVAEGVENEEQLDYLHANGCDIVQGFHLYPPLPADDIPTLVGQIPVGVPAPEGEIAAHS